jgi:hypothetical protein
MIKTEIYKLGKIKQLIDLNGDTTNFDLTFNVTSNDSSEFEALVVDQTTLDNNPTLEYKKAPGGTISGNILADKNVYQNYFLLLRSDNPCECTVKIEKKVIPPNPKFVKENFKEQVVGQNIPQTQENKDDSSKKSKFDFKKLLIVLAVVSGLAFVYFKFIKKPKKDKEDKEDKDNGINKSKEQDDDVASVFTVPSVHSAKVSVPSTPVKKTCDKDVCTIKVETPKISSPVRTPPSLLSKLKTLPSIKKI